MFRTSAVLRQSTSKCNVWAVSGIAKFTGTIRVTLPNFVVIGRTVADIWLFSISVVSIWRPSAILHLLYECLDHPQRISLFGGLYHCAKIDWNR